MKTITLILWIIGALGCLSYIWFEIMSSVAYIHKEHFEKNSERIMSKIANISVIIGFSSILICLIIELLV